MATKITQGPRLKASLELALELAAHTRKYEAANNAFEASLKQRNGGKLPPILSTSDPWPFIKE